MLARVELLFCDADLLALNKPPGLRTLPDGYDTSLPHVCSLLEAEFGRVWIVHRLDKDTSGVLLVARTADAHRALNAQFAVGRVEKVYHALVVGEPPWQEQRVDLPLRPNGDRRHRTVVDVKAGKPALTELRLLEQFPGYALLEARPRTGRTHQVRAHLAALRLPLVGDCLYGGKQATSAWLQRPALHAWSLSFFHPSSGEWLQIHAPYAPDLEAVLIQLRQTR